MGYFWKTTEDERREMIDRYREGESTVAIGRDYGVTRSYVTILARKAGCAGRGRGFSWRASALHARARTPQ
jgi:hypothetical protein